MVYCQECGSEINDVETFCPFCGTNLQKQNLADTVVSEDIESIDNSDTNANDGNSEDSEKGVSSDEVNDETEETVASEKIAETQSTSGEDLAETKTDSGYLDIKTLKDENQSDLENENPELESDKNEIRLRSGLELNPTGEIVNDESDFDSEDAEPELDVSSSQDDIDDLLGDETDEEVDSYDGTLEKEDSEGFVDSSTLSDNSDSINEEQDRSDEEAVGVTTESEDDVNAEPNDTSEKDADKDIHKTADNEKESDESAEDNNSRDTESEEISEENQEQNEREVQFEATTESEEQDSKIHSTPTEIQIADDSEIDAAVSVIDSKALAWKNEEELTTTDAISDEKEKEEEVEEKEEETLSEVPSSESNEEESSIEDNSVSGQEVDEEASNSAKLDDGQIENESDGDANLSLFDGQAPTQIEDIQEPTEEKVEVEADPEETIVEETLENETDSTESSEDAKVNTDDAENAESETTEESENEESVESPPVSSQTTPNIGVGDTDGSKSQKLKPLAEGVVLNNRYEIVRKIGGGGMGAVYLANDKNLGGVLRAVKEMVQSYIEPEQQEKAIQDFKRESMLLTSLDHRSIPTIYDYFYDEKEARFYLVMKYISGGDLSARIRSAPEGKLDETSVTDWALQIADVLDYLHSRTPPIVYRDLKPANIMVDGNTDRVMLIDFGIARWINKEEKGVTAVGTMGYAPPELFSGNVEPGSDIYSLGSTMFHLMTGADPQNNPLLIFDFQKHPRPRQINPQLSDQMERILMRSVEYNAEKRFSSAAEMRNSLKEHLENLKAGNVSYGIKATPRPIALSDQPVFCGFCGQKIVATDMFCAFCGAKQPLAQPGVQSQEYHIPSITAKLVIDGTTELDYQPFDLVKDENLVGRRDPMSNIFPEVDLSKYDPQTKISRKHARIWREGDRFLLEDLGSSNGTIFKPTTNEEVRLMPKQTQVLQSGDKIQIGDTTLQFMVD